MKLVNKLMLCALALSLFAPKMSAQLDKLNYRVEAGLTRSKISNFGTATPLLGFRASGHVVLPFKRSEFALVSGLTLTSKGEANQTFHEKSRPEDNLEGVYNTRLLYLQIPLDISLRLNFHEDHKMYIATGPYFAMGLTASATSDGRPTLKFYEEDGASGQTPFKRTEFGWGANLMYAFKGIYLKSGVELSLTDVMNSTPTVAPHLGGGKRRHGLAYFTLGYQF